MTIGQRIKDRRIEQKMSQEELAIKCGYKSRSSIQKIETARDLPLKKVEIMARALDVSASKLMGWEDDEDVDTGSKLAQISKDQELLDHCIMLQGLSPKERKLIYNQIEYLHYGKD